MTLDQALVAPVSHYIGGMIGAALLTAQEIQVKGRLPELTAAVEQAKTACRFRCQDLLANPGYYAKNPAYTLTSADRGFLEGLAGRIEGSDWANDTQLEDVASFVSGYCAIEF